jgi:hypothetical protein
MEAREFIHVSFTILQKNNCATALTGRRAVFFYNYLFTALSNCIVNIRFGSERQLLAFFGGKAGCMICIYAITW